MGERAFLWHLIKINPPIRPSDPGPFEKIRSVTPRLSFVRSPPGSSSTSTIQGSKEWQNGNNWFEIWHDMQSWIYIYIYKYILIACENPVVEKRPNINKQISSIHIFFQLRYSAHCSFQSSESISSNLFRFWPSATNETVEICGGFVVCHHRTGARGFAIKACLEENWMKLQKATRHWRLMWHKYTNLQEPWDALSSKPFTLWSWNPWNPLKPATRNSSYLALAVS